MRFREIVEPRCFKECGAENVAELEVPICRKENFVNNTELRRLIECEEVGIVDRPVLAYVLPGSAGSLESPRYAAVAGIRMSVTKERGCR